ncbi:MAG: trypsin-like peptidase domain-containing protein [Fimbriimonadaceae bacterium]|nr:trypsin-like peptidase domain-containing protein [Fimbriimonadaceae bacterium]
MNAVPKGNNSIWLFSALAIVIGGVSIASIMDRSSASQPVSKVERKMPVSAASSTSTADIGSLQALDDAFTSVVDYASPAVVNIRSTNTRGASPEGDFVGSMGGTGSGVVFRPDGYILTNDHVVGGFNDVAVTLNDGREFKGKVVSASDSDLAIVKIEATDLPTVKFADSNTVRPGQLAIAIGSPFGLENSVTIGHISALSRQSQIPDTRLGQLRVYPDMIQTDASINMGNSGGPLFNIHGEVIGINTAIVSQTGGSEGIGFAIPSNRARIVAESLIENGKVVRGFLGIGPENIKEFRKKELGISQGAYVAELPNDGPAAVAGIKVGDVVTRIGDMTITNESDLRNAMYKFAPNEIVKVEAFRAGQKKVYDVKAGSPPSAQSLRQQPSRTPRSNVTPPNIRDLFKDIPEIQDWSMPNKDQDSDRVPPVREGKVTLGVTVDSVTATLRKQFSIPDEVEGAVVTSVQPNSVADRLQMKPGDVILSLAGKTIKSGSDLAEAMKGIRWGDMKRIAFQRYSDSSSIRQERDITFR